MKKLTLVMLLILVACSPRPKRWEGRGGATGTQDGGPTPPGKLEEPGVIVPDVDEDLNESLDTYISIGPYLQKEFDAADNASRQVKVFVQIRQENDPIKNMAELQTKIGENSGLATAIADAKDRKLTNIEFEVNALTFKTALSNLGNAVSSAEVSLGAVK